MKKIRILLGLIILSFILLSLNVNSAFVLKDSSEIIKAYNNNNLVRLHVIANSNSLKDQYLKRKVRNELIKYLAQYPPKKIEQKLFLSNLNNIKIYIENILNQEKVNYSVNINFGNYYFPKRTYGELTLPSGKYTALRIILGKGQGANWWCVLIPPLCIESKPKQTISKGNEFAKKDIKFCFKFTELVDFNKYRRIEWARRIIDRVQRKARIIY